MAGAFAALLTLSALPVGASHDPDIDDDELKCQPRSGKCAGKFTRAKLKCLNKCADALQDGDPVDCKDSAAPPAGDNDPRDAVTAACVQAAEDKAIDCIGAKCDATTCPDCPEYENGNCTADAADKISQAESLIDLNDSLLAHCNESGGPNDDELDCMNERAKRGGKLVADLAKCTDKCLNKAHDGDPRQCDPGGTLDATTQACVDAARDKCAEKTDDKCADPPECNPSTGTNFCNTVRGVVDAQYNEYYCGS